MKIGDAREFWKAYQIGQGSADHTQFEVFAETIQPLIDYARAQTTEVSKWKGRCESLANFNPDWDMLEATQESLREHMALLKTATAEGARMEDEIDTFLREAEANLQERARLATEGVQMRKLIVDAAQMLSDNDSLDFRMWSQEAAVYLDTADSSQESFTCYHCHGTESEFWLHCANGRSYCTLKCYNTQFTADDSRQTQYGTGICPYCGHRIANLELELEDDGNLHCNHCRGDRVDSDHK